MAVYASCRRSARTSLFLFVSLILLVCLIPGGGQTCDEPGPTGDTGACLAPSHETADRQSQCSMAMSLCQAAADNLYRHSGSAQAYKANVPIKSAVCNVESATNYYHKVASWPVSRRSSRAAAIMTLEVDLWSCKTTESQDDCCCQTLVLNETDTASVEVWQTRPDGTYASLRKNVDEGDCRAQASLEHGQSTALFETLAPGSTGILGGLGPSNWDFMPYGRPVIHILAADLFRPKDVGAPYFHLEGLEGAWMDSGKAEGDRFQR
jgi:hypothetical protein